MYRGRTAMRVPRQRAGGLTTMQKSDQEDVLSVSAEHTLQQ